MVFKVERDGGRTLEAAMYVLEPPATLDAVPPLGGPLVQYHVHLCHQTLRERRSTTQAG